MKALIIPLIFLFACSKPCQDFTVYEVRTFRIEGEVVKVDSLCPWIETHCGVNEPFSSSRTDTVWGYICGVKYDNIIVEINKTYKPK